MDCKFSRHAVWILLSTDENGERINYCCLVGRNGRLLALHEAVAGDGSWLERIDGTYAVTFAERRDETTPCLFPAHAEC